MMYSSFDDISAVKPYSGSITATLPAKKCKVSHSPKSGQNTNNTCSVWITVLLICCLFVSAGIAVVLWYELNSFRGELYHSLNKQENNETTDLQVVTSTIYLMEQETRGNISEMQTMLEKLESSVAELEQAKLNDLLKECSCPSGIKGEQGIPGVPGSNGLRGEPGPIGPPGRQGERGYTGPSGLTGNPGLSMVGAPGLKGEPGLAAQPGMPGLPGPTGFPGMKGDEGAPGLHGLPGIPGLKGEPGESAVQDATKKNWRNIFNG